MTLPSKTTKNSFNTWQEWHQTDGEARKLDTRYLPSALKTLPKPLTSFLCQALNINDFLPLHSKLPPCTTPQEFAEHTLRLLQTKVSVSSNDLSKIPTSGATVIVCNHPFGALDGIALIATLLKIRPDSKFLVNSVLGVFPELRHCCLPLDILTSTAKTKATNQASLRQAHKHLSEGHLLVVFPSGTVSHWQLGKGVSDPLWQTTAARLAMRNNAPLLPVFFAGQNSFEFQTLGLIHPFLRTMLLPRELKKRIGTTVSFTVGRSIKPAIYKILETPEAVTCYCRARCYALHEAQFATAPLGRTLAPLAPPTPVTALASAFQRLPSSALLVSEGPYQVYLLKNTDAPLIIEELGRTRELTFREAQEGSGKPRDLDLYDGYYEHLVLWHSTTQQIIGGYRLLATTLSTHHKPLKPFYSSSLFQINRKFFMQYPNSMELGRAFIHPTFQAEYAPLLLLWKGIATFLTRTPQIRWLFGPVSLSLDYSKLGLATIIKYFKDNYEDSELSSLVKGRNFSSKLCANDNEFITKNINYNHLSNLVKDIEGNRGLPILFKHYLKLGGILGSFHVDSKFNTIDAFLLLDLASAPPHTLKRYFSANGLAQYLAHHRSCQQQD
ncbi:MAG TPA: lysophospholipid acyltransferase family protein [Candidatus Avacidaminococcus intestinavium]|uniref:Lysophospholipid acyltransferase family protein n=1 Tax=Candidatus Avacidaminococcus intestinavium TaxID=2840684 RepID=A0A9D1SLW2_9FIRM|nr:lysophospholipid acyltransferase family protein [Candidatus Avacidaminococcus intestinavium]